MMNGYQGEPAYTVSELINWRPWRELALFSLMMMDLAWVTPWYRSLTKATTLASPERVFLVFLGVVMIMFVAARLMNWIDLRIALRRVILVCLFVVVLLAGLQLLLYYDLPFSIERLFMTPIRSFADIRLVIPDEFLILLCVSLLGLRGLSLANTHAGPGEVLARFQIGWGMFVLFVLVNTLLTGETPGYMFFIFIFFGIVASGAARMNSLERMRGGRRGLFDRRWLAGMAVISTVMTVFTVWMSLLAEGNLIAVLTQGISSLFAAIFGVLFLLMLPLLGLMTAVLQGLLDSQAIQAVIPQFSELANRLSGLLSGFSEQLAALTSLLLPDPALARSILLWVILGVVILFGIVWTVVRWLLPALLKSETDELDTLDSQAAFSNWLRDGLARMQEWQNQLVNRILAPFSSEHRAAGKIRATYVALLELGEAFGAVRRKAITPIEHQTALMSALPDSEAEIETITAAYVQLRYGEYPEIVDDLQKVAVAWEGLKSYREQARARKNIPGSD